MTYFGGLGSGRGWDSISFILTPDELPMLFDGLKYSFVITNSRVASDYKETPKEDFFQAYKRFFEQILICQEPLTEKKLRETGHPFHQSVIDDINKITFEEIKGPKGGPTPYKLVEPLEPVIDISPFHLLYFQKAEKETLSTAYYNDEGTLGLQLSYPRYITWCNMENPEASETIETHSFVGKVLFETLVERIKKNAKKAKVQSPNKLFRPNFWISKDSVLAINNNSYLRKKRLKIE